MGPSAATATCWKKQGRTVKPGSTAIRANGESLYHKWDTEEKRPMRKICRPGVLKKHRLRLTTNVISEEISVGRSK